MVCRGTAVLPRMDTLTPALEHATDPCDKRALAADADSAECELLLTLARKGPLERDLLIGQGLMGNAAALPVLVDALDHEPTAQWAAAATKPSATGAPCSAGTAMP